MSRRIQYTMLALILTLSLSTPGLAHDSGRVSAQGEAKSYIVLMNGNPVASYAGNIAGFAATQADASGNFAPNSANAQAYAGFLEAEHDKSLESAGIKPSVK